MQGSFRLFRFAGVDVFLHWTWFLAAYFLIKNRTFPYSSYVWDVAEYVAGFGLVLFHEFGHVFACRQVGGKANRVVLWPLGGLAFVAPPPRPGAALWTIAAGPLVNLVLLPVLLAAALLMNPQTAGRPDTDVGAFFQALAIFNAVMLVFNLLPIFPMDGGRILQALLWFAVGRSWSLAIAATVGAVLSGLLCAAALFFRQWYLALLAAFLLLSALSGMAQSRLLGRLARAERRTEFACPNCGSSPPVGRFWRCGRCFAEFDSFEPATTCPKAGDKSGDHVAASTCLDCGDASDPVDWVGPSADVV